MDDFNMDMAKAIAVVLLGAVPIASLVVIYLNRKQQDNGNKGIGGRVIQFGIGMSLVAVLAIAMLIGLATWDAVEKLIFALIAFAAGAYVSSRTNSPNDKADN